jgi:hypothetical protein
MRLASRLPVLPVLAFVAFCATPAWAFTITSISRSISAATHGVDNLDEPTSDSASDGASTTGTEPFDASVAPTCSTLPEWCPPATASQTSTVGPQGFTASGTAYGEAYYNHEGLQQGWMEASSTLSLEFTLVEATPYRVDLFLDSESYSDGGYTNAALELQRLVMGGDLVIAEYDAFDGTIMGILVPGDYRLSVGTVLSANLSDYANHPPSYEQGTWAMTLSVPEPAPAALVAIALFSLVRAARRAGRRGGACRSCRCR